MDFKKDMVFYYNQSKRERFMYWLTNDPIYYIAKYIRLLRKEEYYSNAKNNLINKFLTLYYLSKKNKLGNKLGFKIPRNTIQSGLNIYHHGEIIINEDVKVGKNCKLHGGNCIGNKGINNLVPVIGDNFDLGIGAKVIGNVNIGDKVIVGANAVVLHDVASNSVVAGIPARKISKKKRDESNE